MQQVLTDPIVFVITIIMVTTIGFIALAVIGLDKGVVLKSMGGDGICARPYYLPFCDHDYRRCHRSDTLRIDSTWD